MNYRYYLFGILFFLIYGLSNASEVITPLQCTNRTEVADDNERRIAAAFIANLDGFKNAAEKALDMHKEGYEKLSDREILFLKYCMEANDITRYKVDAKNNAVYKKISSFDLNAPATMCGLEFWGKLLSKNKIDYPLFDEQLVRTEILHAFVEELVAQGLICQYPRTVGGRTVYKAAL